MSSSSIPTRFERGRRDPTARFSVPELSVSSIDTDVRRRGLNPFFTGVTLGIIAFITGFLLFFAYSVVAYLE